MILMEAIFIFFGVYVIFQTQKMKKENKIPSFLVNSKVNLERAKDKDGYIKYMYPRLIIFGVLISAFSTLSIVAYMLEWSSWISTISFAAYGGVIIFYCVMSVKAQSKFLF